MTFKQTVFAKVAIKGKNLVSKLKSIRDSIDDLIPGYEFSTKTNQMLFAITHLDPDITNAETLSNQLKSSIKMYELLAKAANELEKLQIKGKLEATKGDITKFVKAVGALESEVTSAKELLGAIKKLNYHASKLGFSIKGE